MIPYLVGSVITLVVLGVVAHIICDREEIDDIQHNATDEWNGLAKPWELL